MEKTVYASTNGDSIELYHQGAHLTSWRCNNREQLFLSKQAKFTPGQSIRGGVPLIFPQFGTFGSGQKHGFARTADWQFQSLNQAANAVTFCLNDTSQSRALWPHSFAATYMVSMTNNALILSLTVKNTGSETFEFGAALHTYFLVDAIAEVQVQGLSGLSYWDNGTDFQQRHTQGPGNLTIDGPLDRVYFNASKALLLQQPQNTRKISSTGFSDCVIWNPWREGAAALADMDNDEYQQMLCIEAAAVDKPIKLAPNTHWQGQQRINVL